MGSANKRQYPDFLGCGYPLITGIGTALACRVSIFPAIRVNTSIWSFLDLQARERCGCSLGVATTD